ncbi:EcoKI restriction-modification system protein HsdS [Planococcus massiliensis]|uniref:EcoKI restriction-modification system protein HsdS n=1 Tax=Planococcus massiliensis TaxID=1499687 RepID=A0A098ENH1_9BACL|nr:restriction endonuclease subunit S [Planococcus massiliensis]CEG23834.1 EcoKI restriction-modification system protein HsdS [Planococcus massiliensis]
MNVPQLRFNGFKGEWDISELKKLVKLEGGATPLKSEKRYWQDGHIPWVSSQEVGPKKIDKTTFNITEAAVSETSTKMVGKNTILLVVRSGILNRTIPLSITMIPMAINQDIKAMIIKHEKLHHLFLYQWMKKNEKAMLSNVVKGGTTVQSVNTPDLQDYLIKIPSASEQHKIADFFELIDGKIEKQQEKLDKLTLLKKGMMQKIFSQELRFKNEDGEEFSEWETKQLKEFAMKTVKKNRDMKVTNVISNSAKQGLISQRSYFKKDIANELNIDGYYVISKGDFVYNPRISSESPYGPVHIYELEEDGIVSPLYLCFKTKNIDSKFLKYFFMSSQWYKHVYTQGDSGARHDRVSIKDTAFFEMKIAVPSLVEQEKISDFLTSLNLKVEKEREKLMVLEEQKKGFMQGMFV